MSRADTIAAIATAPARAAIGVVRVSGPNLQAFAETLTGRRLAPRQATLASFSAADGAPLDRGIALFFPAPRSYTGEDVLEIQGHGGPVVLRTLLQRCLELGARIAEPGEFTQRAFLNGKLDLVQAEAVIDLIDAGTAEAARGALRSLQGEFSAQIQALSAALIDLRARVEAALDFPEDDIDVLDRADARDRLGRLRHGLDTVLAAARQGSLLREGLNIVFAGQPNVGKSSLLNRLAGEELAIVTDIPGTTRDPVREALDIGGIPVHVADTAGLRESSDAVERIGVERAWAAIGRADVVVVVGDARQGTTPEDEDIAKRFPPGVPRICVMNKIDLTDRVPSIEEIATGPRVWLSARTGAGLDLLREAVVKIAGWHGGGEGVFLARARHLSALRATAGHLEMATELTRPELFAEELRLAHRALMSITGEFSADALLGEIFQRFCLGK
jgi:tRNA modification GTPase